MSASNLSLNGAAHEAAASQSRGDGAPTVVVVIEGGAIQHVLSNVPVKVMVVDYDVAGLERDDHRLRDIPQGDGRTERAYTFIEEHVDAEATNALAKIIDDPQASVAPRIPGQRFKP